jgi:transcriptional regulator with XRE-family HTH domain
MKKHIEVSEKMCAEVRLSVGRRIHELRHTHKLSQQGLAKLAGFHRSSIGPLERGERNAPWTTFARIARALGI